MNQQLTDFVNSSGAEIQNGVNDLLANMKNQGHAALESYASDIESALLQLYNKQMSANQFKMEVEIIKKKVDNEAQIAATVSKRKIEDVSNKISEVLLKLVLAYFGL